MKKMEIESFPVYFCWDLVVVDLAYPLEIEWWSNGLKHTEFKYQSLSESSMHDFNMFSCSHELHTIWSSLPRTWPLSCFVQTSKTLQDAGTEAKKNERDMKMLHDEVPNAH